MVCPHVCGDDPRALVSGLSPVQVDKHGITTVKTLKTPLVITEYSIFDIKLLGTDLFPFKFPLYNRIFT